MSNVVIATFPTQPAVVSGQSLIARTVLDNRGAEAIVAPSRDAQSQFVYFLRSQTGGGPVYGLSQKVTDRRRSPDRVATPPPETEPLAGGAKYEWFEDIAEFWNAGFDPGEYWLTVRYDAAGIESPKSAVTVLPLEVESVSSAVSVDHLSSVVAHRGLDGQVTLLHRESEVLDPREGVFRIRKLLPAGTPVSVATSIDVVPAGNGRWLAWLRDGKLTASNAWGDRVVKSTDPVDAGGALLSPGFQIAVGTALFGTVSPAGRLETYVASSAGLKKGWSAELGTAVGRAMWNAQADGSVTVAWEDAASGKIMRQSFGADGHAHEAVPRAATPGRPLAWGLPASGTPTIWVVVYDGPVPVLARLEAGGERALTRLPELAGATAWDFLQPATGSGVVSAIANEKIQSTRLENGAWHVVADAPRASRLQVVSLDGRAAWAEWIEAGYGVRRVKLP